MTRGFDLLISAGYGTERHIRRAYSWRAFSEALDAVGLRLHNENRTRAALAGADPDEWPGEWLGSEEGRDIETLHENIEAELSASPLVRKVSNG